jgi:hypothetical protein
MPHFAGNLGSRPEHKIPIPHGRVREHQAGGVNDRVAGKQQVQIKRPWPPANNAFPAADILRFQKQLQHVLRIEVAFKECGSIQEFMTGSRTHWCSANQTAAATRHQTPSLEPPQRIREEHRLSTHIAPKGHKKLHPLKTPAAIRKGR